VGAPGVKNYENALDGRRILLTPEEVIDVTDRKIPTGCFAVYDSWSCTRLLNHVGRHIATGIDDMVLAVWED
jgi:hypothetical protein